MQSFLLSRCDSAFRSSKATFRECDFYELRWTARPGRPAKRFLPPGLHWAAGRGTLALGGLYFACYVTSIPHPSTPTVGPPASRAPPPGHANRYAPPGSRACAARRVWWPRGRGPRCSRCRRTATGPGMRTRSRRCPPCASPPARRPVAAGRSRPQRRSVPATAP
jgi:hypothetical protein